MTELLVAHMAYRGYDFEVRDAVIVGHAAVLLLL